MADVGAHRDAAWVLRMGRHGVQVLAVVLALALVFTMVNVQQFAAAGQPVGGVQWFIAWLLDPMASLTMAAAIVFEGLLADHGRPKEPWLTAAKWYAGIATWAMNIWASAAAGSIAGVVLHSVAPGLLLLLAEAAPRVRRSMAVVIADMERDAKPVTVHTDPVPTPVAVPAREPVVARPTWVAPTGPPSWAAIVERPAEPAPVAEPDPLPLVRVARSMPVAPEVVVPVVPVPAEVPVGVIPWPVDPPAGPLTDDQLDAEVARLVRDAVDAGGPRPGRQAITDALGPRATPYRVRMSLKRVGDPTVLVLNGAGPSEGQLGVNGQGGAQ